SLTVIFPTEGHKTITLTATVSYGITTYTKTLTLTKDLYNAARAFFVTPDGTAGSIGASWGSPTTLETALLQATPGDFIWLQEGTYTPSSGNSFTLTKDGVEIYGGFTGDETYLYERNFAEHQTVLRGNGNSVMQIVGVTTASRIDGVIVEGGSATDGGGIRLRNASPTIANLIIRANSATNGGGIYIESGSSPLIYNTEISGNTASKGGGMYNYIANPRIYNTTIGGNRATTTGGGVFNSGSTPEFGNSIIAGNQSGTSLMSSVKLRNLNSANVANEYSAPIYAYSMIQGSGGSTNWNANYGTDKGRNLDGADPYQTSGFADDGSMQEGDYRLRDYSAPVNAGSVSFLNVQSTRWDTPLSKVDLNAIIRGVPYDLSQSERIIDDLIDMGAYEFGGERLYPTIMRLVVLPEVKGITTDPPAGRHSIPSQSDFVFTVTALDGYDLEGLTVTTGIPIRDKEGIKITANADGTKTVKILQVTEPLTLHISGFTGYTGKSEVDKTKVWSYGNTLYISTSNPAQVRIFNMSGILFKAQNIAAGETEIQLPQGFFVIIIGERRWKVVIK
ncbi:MAG: right-handed parallel beta-helix repeat-containing protein, partial [Tannerella sp.]|nr:right-handed parallel beta-helix repeat-containing protein [Tannerella sp.]